MDAYRQMIVNSLSIIRNQKGQGLVEYGLIVMLVSIVAISLLHTIGIKISLLFNNATSAF